MELINEMRLDFEALPVNEAFARLTVSGFLLPLDPTIEELADVIIIALSAAGHIGVNIDEAVRRKMEINRARPYKHEGEGHG